MNASKTKTTPARFITLAVDPSSKHRMSIAASIRGDSIREAFSKASELYVGDLAESVDNALAASAKPRRQKAA
jgi:hypothetical protein